MTDSSTTTVPDHFLFIALHDTIPYTDRNTGWSGTVTCRTVYATIGLPDCFRYCSAQVLINLRPMRVEITSARDADGTPVDDVSTIFSSSPDEDTRREAQFNVEMECLHGSDSPTAVPFDSIVDQWGLARRAVSADRLGAWTVEDMADYLRNGVPRELAEAMAEDREEIEGGTPWWDVAAEIEAEGVLSI